MTDRYNHLTVVLEREIREDDAEHMIHAIRMIKGVLDVKGGVANVDHWIAQSKADSEWKTRIINMLKTPTPGANEV